MEYVGYGILCFGKKNYFNGADHKIEMILKDENRSVFVLTDNVKYFDKYKSNQNFHVIEYIKSIKSYHDKVLLVKYIHKHTRIAILLDADLHIEDESVFDILSNEHFGNGVTYIDTLGNHISKMDTVADVDMSFEEWESYRIYVERIYPEFKELETIWEYFIVFNRRGIIDETLFEWYERLQIAKDFSDLRLRKEVSGAGEGISINIACKVSKTPIQRDKNLYDKLKNLIKPITRHTPTSEIPIYLR
jgi:hypothetical protein